ncbi:MAG: PHP domain-containing protein [Candidatus Berkelbacteria bacterium]|nr:PHP domain-containing protein [Candidatus Berkelbacteria bacterium]
MKFCHLHVHSHYSLLDGLTKIDQLIKKAKKYEMSALALTDHGVMYGTIEFYKKAKEAGIKPIIGLEAYIAPRSMHDKQPRIDASPYHLVLLAKNNNGYKNLIKISSISHLEGYYYKPRIDKKTLKKYSSGLIALSACLKGEVSQVLLSNDLKRTEEIIREYQDIFGEDNFYLELQDHPNIPEQRLANERMIALSQKLKVPLVATNDVHYLDPDDKEAQEVLLCVQTGRMYDDPERLSMQIDDFSFKSPSKMMESFKDIREAIENTDKIAKICNVDIELGIFIFPQL